jgi:hypothetical protein
MCRFAFNIFYKIQLFQKGVIYAGIYVELCILIKKTENGMNLWQ